MLEPDEEKTGYVVTRGCIEEGFKSIATCENALRLVYCCNEDMCNWNITPPFPTTLPGMCKLSILLQQLSQEISLVKNSYFLFLQE